MNINGNKIQVYDADNDWHHNSVQTFLKDKEFSYLNICYRFNEKYRIFYILVNKEEVSKERDKASI